MTCKGGLTIDAGGVEPHTQQRVSIARHRALVQRRGRHTGKVGGKCTATISDTKGTRIQPLFPPTTMVHTRATTKKLESGQASPQDSAVALSPSKKRRRDGPESFKKRHRGKPSPLCQLNLDVLFLVRRCPRCFPPCVDGPWGQLAEYIQPLDLLNLARTCKSLRELLMDKSATSVWRSARRQVEGLPDCPDDLTEPEYANLVFYARCHVRSDAVDRI